MEPLIIFTHIPKTAGSTITSVIDAVYPRRAVAKIYSDSDGPAFMAQLDPRVRFLTGHFPYGLHRYTARPCRYFTILRQPAERVVSLYYYLRRAADHASHGRVLSGDESLLDVVNSQTNIQTNFIAGVAMNDRSEDPAKLEQAKQHLMQEYALCGLAERFDESLLLLQGAFGWRFSSYRQQNVTRKRPPRESVPEEVRAALEANNRLDQQLYDWAKGRFEAQVAEQPGDFQDRLEKLRSRTRQMGHVHAVTETAHRWVKRLAGKE